MVFNFQHLAMTFQNLFQLFLHAKLMSLIFQQIIIPTQTCKNQIKSKNNLITMKNKIPGSIYLVTFVDRISMKTIGSQSHQGP